MNSSRSPVLLIVEDDPGLQSQMRWCLEGDVGIELSQNAEGALATLRRCEPAVVTLDLGLPPDPGGTSVGFGLLHEMLALAPRTKVIVITGRDDPEHAAEAIGRGAFDFYRKPVDNDTLRFVVERAFRIRELEDENERLQMVNRSPIDGIVGSSDAMLKVCRTVEKVGPADVSTLIQGETGTGKELIARALHGTSRRADGPFIAINCAAIPENLLESELFGYEKGAFTGANAQKKGKIEHADGGTLFLDEIGDMPIALQSKMLRFLQERSVDRVGGRQPVPVDVRVVCATHRDIKAMVAESDFREDLYYRLSEITIPLPPIRDRPGDALLIANTLLKRFAEEQGAGRISFSPEAREAIEAWDWPGNVREMENRIKRAVILCEDKQVGPDDLEIDVKDSDGGDRMPLNLRRIREEAERGGIQRALAMAEDNVSQAARLLGITRPTLYSLMKKYDLEAGTS